MVLFAAALLAVKATPLAAAATLAFPTPTVTALAMPAGALSITGTTIRNGIVAGYATFPAISPGGPPVLRATLWNLAGQPTDVSAETHGGLISGLRSAQLFTGNCQGFSACSFIYDNGTYRTIPNVLRSYDLSPTGEVVGYTSNPMTSCTFAATYSSASSLATLPGARCSSWAQAITALGDVAGTNPTKAFNVAAAWIGGTYYDIGTLGGCESIAAAINISDTVVGMADTKGQCAQPFQAFSWTRKHGIVGLGQLPGTVASAATGISSRGTVSGVSYFSSLDQIAWIHRAGRLSSIDDLLGANSGWYIAAGTIDGQGQLLGYGYQGNAGQPVIVNLNPPTPPTSFNPS